MNILFLGPPCASLESALARLGHTVHRVEGSLTLAEVRRGRFDFGLSYRYRHILRPEVIDLFSGRLVNLHISLLPWNRGSDPNLWSFLDDTPKGVTVHRIDAGVHTGDILLQEDVRFDEAVETLSTTYAALSHRIERLFLKNAPALLAGLIAPQKQAAGGSCHRSRDKLPYLPLLEKSWCQTPVRQLRDVAVSGCHPEREREKVCVRIIPATAAHRTFLFRIINDPSVRAMSFDCRPVTWETHCSWFARRMDEKIPFYLGILGNEPCGYVRFQAANDPWDEKCEDVVVSVALHPHFRGRGLAVPMLRAACREVLRTTNVHRIHAHVKSANAASLATFRRCHFASVDKEVACGGSTETFIYPGYEE